MDPWIVERIILTPKNSSVDQINAIILQELLHREATFYPVLTVQVILEIVIETPLHQLNSLAIWLVVCNNKDAICYTTHNMMHRQTIGHVRCSHKHNYLSTRTTGNKIRHVSVNLSTLPPSHCLPSPNDY